MGKVEKIKTEMEKIKDALKIIGYEQVSINYQGGAIISRFASGEKAIHLEFGHKMHVFCEDEVL